MIDNIFNIKVFSYCLLIFVPAFIGMNILSNYLIRRLKVNYLSIYKKVIGDVDDEYINQWGSIRFMHSIRLDLLVFSGKYLNEIGKWTTVIYILGSISYIPALLYIIVYIFIHMITN